jgi:lysozyme family protein
MADNFEPALAYALQNEGGYSHDANDPGGETYRGISRVTFGTWEGWAIVDQEKARPAFPDSLAQNAILETLVAQFYQANFWKFGGVIDPRVAVKLFDSYVNRPTTSVRCLQLALNALQAGPVVADGKYGAQTEAHVNAADPTKLLDELKAQLVKARFDYLAQNPGQAGDLLGWLRRDVKG